MIRKILETSTRTSIVMPQVDEFSRVYLEDLNIKPYRMLVDNLQKNLKYNGLAE